MIDINACINCGGREFGKPPRRRKDGKPILAPCERVCPTGACDRSVYRDPNGEVIEVNVGAIIVATGYRVMDKWKFKEYSPESPNVITALQMERILSATGPTDGNLILPSDIPKYQEWKRKGGELNVRRPSVIAYISCVGSRDERYHTYCSKVCCMYMLKQAMLIKEKYPDVDVYIFFIDVRTPGKDFEEYYTRCRNLGVKIVRGKVGGVQRRPDGRLLVRGFDNDLGEPIELVADMVVLATAIEPSPGLEELARKLGVNLGAEGFLRERHTKLYPVDTLTEGVFICGCAQGPKDIPESVAQAKAAASSVMALLSKGKMRVEPLISEVDQDRCIGCGICANTCPFKAIELVKMNGRRKAKVNEALCKGCGVCSVACPRGAITLHGFTKDQIYAQIRALTGGE